MRVVGLDLSLTSTGAAVIEIGDENAAAVNVELVRPKSGVLGLDRLRQVVHEAERIAAGADLVVIEGPSYGSTGGSAHERAGLWWLVRNALDRAGVPVAVVAPTQRAKYATGKGNAGKDAVVAHVARRFPGVDADAITNDTADALVLAAMGARRLGHPIDDMPRNHQTALDAVDWPALRTPEGATAS